MIIETAPWLDSPAGRYLLGWEQRQLDHVVADIFGYHAVQLGWPMVDALRASRIGHRWLVGDGTLEGQAELGLTAGSASVVSAYEALPFPSGSLDLVVLPHTLEVAGDAHQTLREVERVLMPEGRLLITGFNPWSLWGLRRLKPGEIQQGAPWLGNALALSRLKDWLALLGLETLRGEFLCYNLPLQREGWLGKTRFLELAGDRWWPTAGSVYCLEVVKRVKGMRIIEPQWRRVPAARSKPAAVAEKNVVIKETE